MCDPRQPIPPAELPLADVADRLLPRPRAVRSLPGGVTIAAGMALECSGGLEAPEMRAIERFCATCAANVGVQIPIAATGSGPPRSSVRIAPAGNARALPPLPGPTAPERTRAQAYRLRVADGEVDLTADAPIGLHHGLQTMQQLLVVHGDRWPGVEIDDAPDFPVRGLSYDISRGRVPTLAALKSLVDRLASLKVNQLQLYIEHTFAFAFDPAISAGCSPLTADEIRALDAHCAGHRIELVPSLALFGHMGRILSLPCYRHLAEIPTDRDWEQMSWVERMRGLTLVATHPESRALIERMVGEVLPLFSSPLVNVCCDETFDLGQGQTRHRAEAEGIGPLYMEHLAFLDRLCCKYGKRVMFWGDIIKKHPECLPRVPRDAIVLDWAYSPDADCESASVFIDAGLTTFVCPGTSSWNRALNDINAADLNIRRQAAVGKQLGAAGLVNTDWGDEGNVNLPAGSWHPMALGAALAWNADGPTPNIFDRAFGRLFLDDDSGDAVAALRNVAAASAMPRPWPAFCADLRETLPEDTLSDDAVDRWQAESAAAARLFVGRTSGDAELAQDYRELATACSLNALFAERFAISRQLVRTDGVDASLAARLVRFAEQCDRMTPEYEATWLARSKPSYVHEIIAVFGRLATQARAMANMAG